MADETARRPVIPTEFDPTFEGEPDLEAGSSPEGEELDGVLQVVESHPEFEPLRDPEDEPLEFPAEEQAIHIERP